MTIKFLSLDIDNTLIDEESLDGNFSKYWLHTPQERKPRLCYNTGRLLDDTLNLIKNRVLPPPDFIISGVGTNIYNFEEKKLLKEFSEILEEGWDLMLVQRLVDELPFDISKQPHQYQHAYKQSYFLDNANEKDIDYIETQFREAELEVNIIYSGNRFLDFLPKWANKGNALKWLLRRLEVPVNQTIVAGDSGNDNTMFTIPDIKGIVVANAQEELLDLTKRIDNGSIYHAEKPASDGVVEGLRHFKVLPEEQPMLPPSPETSISDQIIEYLDEEKVDVTEIAEIENVQEGYWKAIEAIRHNITPLGFTACSMEHNPPRGTDANYRSVWARDSAITIIGTLPLIKDKQYEDIKKCQIDTFETLLHHISPSGQIPSNVRIDDNTPDYSGVGGICSIDSGLWVIIAFHDYIKATRDMDFLRKHLNALQCIMDWLSAHDGNNDALLEIPEAGDWTDLLGRSYNILYDEILWYRANICFGRLLELVGKNKQAGDYLSWSQVIKKEILLNFWPSTTLPTAQTITFAEQQYSLGDARYLIAQVTPFDFSWRCDVYGNLLAYLYDVLDKEKATLAFRFMWGVGVNNPYPVSNLYPVISPGDPDWRSYYTVNLLNLPYHYHNGGVWPFIGAFWVRFINKIGLRNLAIKELCKLAHVNKLGVSNEWEFNEWAHGTTGRPMGKIYQAWSAAQYLLACYELKIMDIKT